MKIDRILQGIVVSACLVSIILLSSSFIICEKTVDTPEISNAIGDYNHVQTKDGVILKWKSTGPNSGVLKVVNTNERSKKVIIEYRCSRERRQYDPENRNSFVVTLGSANSNTAKHKETIEKDFPISSAPSIKKFKVIDK